MSLSKQETQRQFVLHFWNNGIRDVAEIQRRTSISRSTIYSIIKKIKETGTVEHVGVTADLERSWGEHRAH